MRREWLISTIILCVVFTSSLSAGTDRLSVYVVNYPLKYFAERIAGEHATVILPTPAGTDPAFWMPDAKTITNYQRADLILLNGANYAKWINKVALPQFRLVDTSANFKDRYIKMSNVMTHTHGPKGEHAHEGVAFTIWLDFELAAQQAKEIARAFSRKKPALRDLFQSNYAALEKDLAKLDREIKQIVAKNPELPLLASHPVYDYLSRRYGLNIKSVHWEPDQVPNRNQSGELQAILNNHPAQWIIWEEDPLPATVERLKSSGIQSVVFNPSADAPNQGDFLSVMRRNVENLRAVFSR
jgi:zinc transport system substrate-binding protein